MPAGVPVANVALDGARNAGILAAQILGAHDKKVGRSLDKFKEISEDQSRDPPPEK
jgi:5-(carboxyamino)imidazole ribonucleotide mutase